MLSHAESETGSQLESHRALSEAYALLGNYQSGSTAIENCPYLGSKDDFYVQASITAKIKELKALAHGKAKITRIMSQLMSKY